MNRKKTIDYTVTRRPRDSYSQLNSSKSRADNRDQRGRGDGGQEKKPFWSRDDKNVGSESKYSSVLKDLQEEISRSVLSADSKDSYSRERSMGPIIDEFSEDAYNLRSSSTSKRTDYRDIKDQERRERDSRKRSYSPLDDRSSYRKSREDTPTKRSHRSNDGDDLRDVLKQYQKSKWEDNGIKDRKKYDSKDRGSKRDSKRSKDSLGVLSSSDMFTMSSQGTLVSLPLEPLSENKDYFDSGFTDNYRVKDQQEGSVHMFGDSANDRERRDSRDYSSGSYSSSKQDTRGNIDDRLRALSGDLDNKDSRYRSDSHGSSNNPDIEGLLQQYKESATLFESSSLSSDTLMNLAGKAGEKFKSGFELGRPFFGFETDHQGKEKGWQDPKFAREAKRGDLWNEPSDSLLGQRDEDYGDFFDKDGYLAQQGGKEMAKDQLGNKQPTSGQRDMQDNKTNKRGSLTVGYKPFKSGPVTTSKTQGNSSFKSSPSTITKTGPKPLFPSGFLPRQVKVPLGNSATKAEVNKGKDSPPLLPRKSGYFPRNSGFESRSRSKSSERADDESRLGNTSNSKREVKSSGKGKFTTQNWSGLGSNGKKDESKESNSLLSPQVLGSTGGKANKSTNNICGRGGFQQKKLARGGLQQKPLGRGDANANNRGRGARGRGRGIRGRGFAPSNRGRGFVPRGRGFALRGRGRGLSKAGSFPPGATVRNIFRRSSSPSPTGGRYRKSSRSPGSPRRHRSRSSRGNRSRSRSSSYCSTCSSGSCSTCHSWHSISVDSLSGKGDKDKKRHSHHKGKGTHKEDMEKKSAKLKADIRDMEKQLDEKKSKDTSVKKPSEKKLEPKYSKDVSKSKVDLKSTKDVSKSKLDQKTTKGVPENKLDTKATKSVSKAAFKEDKSGKLKDQKGSLKDVKVKVEKNKSTFDPTKDLKKKKDNSREVILKSDKRKDSPLVIKKEQTSPAREVKIVSEKRIKGDKGLDERLGSKMKIDSLKITIDQPEPPSDAKKKYRNGKDDYRRVEERKKSSKSPPGKQKKKDKEKVKPKKAKKKSKKRKNDRGGSDSGDESVYSSLSEFSSSYDEKSKYIQPSFDGRIVEFSSEAHDSNKITVHYVKRKQNDSNYANSRKLSEGDDLKSTPSRRNLITIPLPKEPNVHSSGKFLPNIQSALPPQEGRHDYPSNKGEKDEDNSDALYSEISYTGNDSNVDWETSKFTEEFPGESTTHGKHTVGDQDYGGLYQGSEGQEWTSVQDEGVEYYYEEGAEGEGYDHEYYSYPQEDAWQGGEQAEGEYQGDNQEWYEGEYPQDGVEGGGGAEYEGQYYLGEDGLYYPAEGETYEYQGEYVEGAAEGEAVDPEQGAGHAEEGYVYQYGEEGAEGEQYEEGAAYHTEEGWVQAEGGGQWEGYQESYAGAEAGWGTEYGQGSEYEASGQEYAAEEAAPLQEGYSAVEGQGYEKQLVSDHYYADTYPTEEGHQAEYGFEPQQQEEAMEPIYSEVTVPSEGNSKGSLVVSSKDNAEEPKPLKSILKKGKQGENKGTKLVSERLAQFRNQPTSKIETPQLGSASNSVTQTGEKTEQDPGQEAAVSAQSQSEHYREMEEAILSSQPKDAIGTEYIVRVHESGTANFFCQLCNCHFNTLTAKNLHVKGMKHIELYIRLKSSLLKSVIKDTKTEASKRPPDEDPPGAQKFPRRF